MFYNGIALVVVIAPIANIAVIVIFVDIFDDLSDNLELNMGSI